MPDLVIYLQASVDSLLERIARRGVGFERAIERSYLENLTGQLKELKIISMFSKIYNLPGLQIYKENTSTRYM